MEVQEVSRALPVKFLNYSGFSRGANPTWGDLNHHGNKFQGEIYLRNQFNYIVYQVQNSQDLQDGNVRKMMLQFKSIGPLLAECPFPWRTGSPSWVLVRPSADQIKPTHIMKSNLFCTVSTDSNVNPGCSSGSELSRLIGSSNVNPL